MPERGTLVKRCLAASNLNNPHQNSAPIVWSICDRFDPKGRKTNHGRLLYVFLAAGGPEKPKLVSKVPRGFRIIARHIFPTPKLPL